MEKTNLSLAEAHIILVHQILQMREKHQISGTTAVIKTECKSSALVESLRLRSQNLNPQKTTRLLPLSVKNQPEVLVMRERLWGLKIGNMLVFDIGNYSLEALLQVAVNIPMAKIYSDCTMNYYSTGRRVMRQVKPIALVNNFRNPPLVSWLSLDWESAQKFFPEETERLQNDYPQIKPKHWRLLTDENIQTLVIAQDESYDYYIPFQCVLNGYNLNSEHCHGIITRLSGYGNLQPIFREFSKMLAGGGYDEVQKDDSLRNIERTYYCRNNKCSASDVVKFVVDYLDGDLDYFDGDDEEPVSYKVKKSVIEMKVGFADIPYEQAVLMVKDKNELKRSFILGERVFSVSADGEIIDARRVVNSRNFKAGNGSPVVLLPDNVYEAWGRDFSPQMVAFLSRDRKFNYSSYGNDCLRNLTGRELEQFKTAKRVANALIGGVKVTSKMTSAGLTAALEGLMITTEVAFESIEQRWEKMAAGKTSLLEKIKDLFGDTQNANDPYEPEISYHYSAPERGHNITGRYY